MTSNNLSNSNKIIINIVVILLLALHIGGCRKEINLKLEGSESKLVINGELNTNETIKVSVSRSLNIFTDDSTYYIDNAQVKLYEDNQYIGNLTYFMEKYNINYIPKAGKNYLIEVAHPNYTTANANVKMPNQLLVNSTYKDSVSTDASGFKVGQLSIQFVDDGSRTNYYQLLVRMYDTLTQDWSTYKLLSADPIFNNNQKNNDGSYIFSNSSFKGQTKTLNFNVTEGNQMYKLAFEVSLKIFDETYYQYLQQVVNFSNNDYNTSTPLILQSNVSNGLGMVGAVYNDKDTIFAQ